MQLVDEVRASLVRTATDEELRAALNSVPTS
jgi:hypothetical protein